jgi:hypothetical protein
MDENARSLGPLMQVRQARRERGWQIQSRSKYSSALAIDLCERSSCYSKHSTYSMAFDSYHSKYEQKNTDLVRYMYHCSQIQSRQHKPRKVEDADKHRDKHQMATLKCGGWLHITVIFAYEIVITSSLQLFNKLLKSTSDKCSRRKRRYLSRKLPHHFESGKLSPHHLRTMGFKALTYQTSGKPDVTMATMQCCQVLSSAIKHSIAPIITFGFPDEWADHARASGWCWVLCVLWILYFNFWLFKESVPL